MVLIVSMQKSFFKNMHQDIGQNVSNFAGLVWKADFGHYFGNILRLGAYFSTGQFEDHEPYNLNDFFYL